MCGGRTCEPPSNQYTKLALVFSIKWQSPGKDLSVVPLSIINCMFLTPLSKWVWKYRGSAGYVISYCFSVGSSPFTT